MSEEFEMEVLGGNTDTLDNTEGTTYQPTPLSDTDALLPKQPQVQSAETAHDTEYPLRPVSFIMATAVLQSCAQIGTQAILTFYFQHYASLGEAAAVVFVNAFIVLYNVFGAGGAVLSDYVIGNYKAELYSSVVWSLGAVIWSLSVIPFWKSLLGATYASLMTLGPAFLGLFLISLGYGVINPIQSVFVADQFRPGQEQFMVNSFSWYYFWCNVGNIVGEFGAPALRQYVGYFSVVGSLTLLIIAGTAVFFLGRNSYRKIPPKAYDWSNTSMSSLKGKLRELGIVFRVLLPIPIFYAMLYQQSSTWVIQGESMRTSGIPPDIMPSLDDILCVVLIPLFNYIIFPLYSRITGRELHVLNKMTCGMVCMAVSFGVTGLLQRYIRSQPRKSVTILWQVPQYVFVSAGEILVAIPGSEFAYSQAPPNMKNTVTAMWYIANALGGVIVAVLAYIPLLSDAQEQVFYGYAVAMLAFLVTFFLLTRGVAWKATEATHVVIDDDEHEGALTI